jgi:hypothetical protein
MSCCSIAESIAASMNATISSTSAGVAASAGATAPWSTGTAAKEQCRGKTGREGARAQVVSAFVKQRV